MLDNPSQTTNPLKRPDVQRRRFLCWRATLPCILLFMKRHVARLHRTPLALRRYHDIVQRHFTFRDIDSESRLSFLYSRHYNLAIEFFLPATPLLSQAIAFLKLTIRHPGLVPEGGTCE